MNEILAKRITIDFDVWSAFKGPAMNDVDVLIAKLKTKELMTYCGNVKLRLEDVTT